ncbi:hypothetical protein Tco_0716705 [Tanacetum coccineum]
MGSLSSYPTELFPLRKSSRFISSKASIEEITEIDPNRDSVDMELGIFGDEDDEREFILGDGNGKKWKGGNGNENGRNENPDENGRGDRLVARECTYQDFMKCQPLNFKGRKEL